MAVQVLGKVAYFNKGAYNSQTNYEINDVVSYNGSSYVSLNDNNQGNLPTNTNYWSVVAEKGDKGDTGKPFVIEKTYSTIESMVADYDNMNVNDYVMIQGSIEEQENATLWTKREVEVSPYKWAYLADFSGASGITGATPNIHIGTVTEGNEPSVTRRSGSSNENPILDFVLKTGAKGDTGATGNGISSIEKTSTSGLVDTYTITFTNGTSTTIEVTNGRGIVSIAKTSSVDYVDTYTITYNDGTTSTFEVTNSEVTEEEFDDVVDELNYLYDDLPKVEEEGTNLTLDNTRKGKMSNILKGNDLSQFTTTGKNKLNSLGTYSAGTTRTSNGVNYTFNEDGSITINGTATGTSFALLIGETLNDYQTEKFRINEDYVAGNWSNANIQLTTRGTDGEYRTIYKGNNPDIVDIKNIPIGVIFVQVVTNATVNETIYPQIELGNTQTSYEKFTGGNPAPNPDYPQDVEVVSGNNTIKVEGKNLLPTNASYWESGHYDTSGVKAPFSTRMRVKNLVPISPSTTYYVFNALNKQLMIREYNANKEFIYNRGVVDSGNTFITQSNTYYLGISIEITYSEYDETTSQLFMCNNNVVDKTYEPYQSASYPINLGVENLWKNQLSGFLPQTGDYPTTNSSYPSARYVLIPLIAGQSITLSGSTSTNGRVRYIDKSTNQIVGTISQETNAYYTSTAYFTAQFNNGTITANKEFIVGIMDMSGSINDLVVNYGTRPLTISDTPIELCKIGDYQDYIYKDNDKWYLHKEIGKVVLDGSENWGSFQIESSGLGRAIVGGNNIFYNSDKATILCNKLKGVKYGTSWTNTFDCIASFSSNRFIAYLIGATDLTTFKNKLASGFNVYYVLATPTNTEITDSTLLSQLNALEKALSYNTQTNISQENNDLPFIISASAFMSLKYLFGNLETRVAELETSEPSEL